MQHSVTELCSHDRFRQICLDPILNNARLENRVDRWPPRRIHRKAVRDQLAQACREL